MIVDKSRRCSPIPESDAIRMWVDLTLGSVVPRALFAANEYSPHRSVRSSPCYQRGDEIAADVESGLIGRRCRPFRQQVLWKGDKQRV